MTPGERVALEEVVRELEGDVRQARTRDESVRLTRRVLRLRAILVERAVGTPVG